MDDKIPLRKVLVIELVWRSFVGGDGRDGGEGKFAGGDLAGGGGRLWLPLEVCCVPESILV
jgi:hypothetical protein